jgi:CRP-like cAMP-binding protein
MLHKIPFFQMLPELALMRICASLKHVTYHPSVIDVDSGMRECIFAEGEIAHEMYVIVAGAVCTTQRTNESESDSNSIALGTLRSGDFFGELAVLLPPESKPVRTRTAYAKLETCMATMSYEDLRTLRQEDAEINFSVLPFMEEAAATCLPEAIDNRARYPDETAYIHDRIDSLDTKIDKLIQLQQRE